MHTTSIPTIPAVASVGPDCTLDTDLVLSVPALGLLGDRLVAEGCHPNETSIAVVVDAARRRNLRTVLVDVLADPSQPEIARLRAFGDLTVVVARNGSAPTVIDVRRADTMPVIPRMTASRHSAADHRRRTPTVSR